MADPASYGNHERDVEQALIALKKGTQLIKYSRKGKPKLRSFRVSIDETTLIWHSRGKERNLQLASISRIIPGQRTAVFKRYPCGEKDYLSFSLLYNNGERSLDLICKDKAEADLWFAGLKALISPGQRRRSKIDAGSEDGVDFLHDARSLGAAQELAPRISFSPDTKPFLDFYFHEPSFKSVRSDVGSVNANMHLRANTVDGFRLSVSSAAPSYSSQGSGPDDCESLGDVYVWGEVWSDGNLGDGSGNSHCSKTDVLLPKSLESNVVIDVHQIACGVRHAALITRQGEVFTWGEESGGRLGHGIDRDFSRPHVVDSLVLSNMDFIACGEYHTCAISTAGDLFSWGDGTYNAGLLGHGTDISHWMPKRICGTLEGLQVLSIACGTWHSALITSRGKLFTFGDGTFGVLGHGDRESVAYPRLVESMSGLKTIKVACGVWHTAAIVEVIGQQGGNNLSRKLFTWGDGDKNRLGHGDKEPRLVPTFVSSLIDYNFQQLACGHSITVALSTSGHVFTMGSTAYGQLGNPQADGKMPCFVQDKLIGEFVDEISCGAYHVAVLTTRSEVFTWGKGANGRLGHGDVEDRKTPTLVEALKDKHVKSVSCGSNFTASICIHKWISSADQSVCSGCRQTFGFTRKRHNCYNCGLVHCHACSSKKVLRAALAPAPGKPHRVCDSCYAKLKASEAGPTSNFKRIIAPRRSIDIREKFDRGEMRSSRILLSPSTEPVTYLEVKGVKQGMKSESLSLIRASQVPSLLQLKDISFPSSLSVLQNALKPVVTSTPQPAITSRPASPYSRRPSPPRSGTPVFSRGVVDNLMKTNEILNQDVQKLQAQIRSLRHKCELQNVVVQKSEKKVQEAISVAAEESSKCSAAKELIKSLTSQMNDMAEKLAPESYDINNLRSLHAQVEALVKKSGDPTSEHLAVDSSDSDHKHSLDKTLLGNKGISDMQLQQMDDSSYGVGLTDTQVNANAGSLEHGIGDFKEATPTQSIESEPRSPKLSSVRFNDGNETHLIEHFEPGVYVTLVQLHNGTKIFKRVRFSKRRFDEQHAEDWWKENKERVYKKYNYPGIDNAAAEGDEAASSHA